MTPDPYEAGPPEYQPDEEPTADDIGVLYAAAAYEQTTWEWIREQEEEAERSGKPKWPTQGIPNGGA